MTGKERSGLAWLKAHVGLTMVVIGLPFMILGTIATVVPGHLWWVAWPGVLVVGTGVGYEMARG